MIKWGVIPADTNDEGEEVPRLTRPPGPEDVAAMCRFLASPAADMITGEAIRYELGSGRIVSGISPGISQGYL